MTITLREDIAFVMLKKIQQSDGRSAVQFSDADFTGYSMQLRDFLSHIDYLNQKGFIDADFSGDAYADSGPNPLPADIHLKSATLTESGEKLLKRMEENPPESFKQGAAVPIATENTDFLEKVRLKGNLSDIFDARDVTTVIYRTMRDLMPTSVSDSVAAELHEPVLDTNNKALQKEVADLWTDTNPIVSFISAMRPPLEFDTEQFLRRVKQEAGLPGNVSPEMVVSAVFSATKEELPDDKIQQVEGYLPAGIQTLWQAA
ncbi:MAG: DUF2267 domain-containing protein [Cyanobacteria bacterium J06639_1]